jgi:methionine-S-sulfoxide reductase
MKRLSLLVLTLLATGLVAVVTADKKDGDMSESKRTAAVSAHTELAIFAGGCFWCMEPPFEKQPGVLSVTSGYTGGHKLNPTYHEVSAGGTGHTEAIEIVFDPAQISYPQLLEILWMNIDPTDGNGQFVDRGNQYRSAIFYLNEEQRRLAEASKQELEKSGRFEKPIVTEIVAASTFYPAEDYHQDYYKKNPLRYKFYRYNSGRDRFLDQEWGDERHD